MAVNPDANYVPPAGFEEIFTPDILKKLDVSKNNDCRMEVIKEDVKSKSDTEIDM